MGSAAARLQIACDHFDDAILNVYGAATRRPSDGGDVATRLQVVLDDGEYWLSRSGVGVTGPFNRHGAFLEIQRHLLSTAHAPRRTNLILHASAILDETIDRSIILAGGSGSGKSSLTAAFLFRGYRFLADDTAIIDADTRELWRLRLPLRLKEGTWRYVRSRVAEAFDRWDSIREPSGREVWRLHPKLSATSERSFAPTCAAILFLIYESGASMEVSKIETLAALALMVESGAWFETSEQAMADTIHWLSGVPCYSVIFSSAEDVVTAVQDLFRTDAASAL